MKTYSLLVGARAAFNSGEFSPAQERLLLNVTREHFPQGFTLLRARGGWWNPDAQRFEREESREVRVVCSAYRPVLAWARGVCTALKQKEVLITEIGCARRVVGKRSRR